MLHGSENMEIETDEQAVEKDSNDRQAH